MHLLRLSAAVVLALAGVAAGVLWLSAGVRPIPKAAARTPGPPPELKAACVGKQAGDVCQATLPDRTITGTCGQGRHHEGRDDALLCRATQPRP